MTLRVVGVRHHSPACARLVQQLLEELRPAWVLIEGPADFNPRLHELLLAHAPPIALYTSAFDGERRYASWAPFCVHSPEWVALRRGSELGSEVRFIDLPGWSRALRGRENRYADAPAMIDPGPALQAAMGQVGMDAFWDSSFELPPAQGLEERLNTYFHGLRECAPGSDSDDEREAFMCRWIRWAHAQGGDVLVVCGGFHAPVLARALDAAAEDEAPQVEADEPPVAANTWLIPFQQTRLDAFAGYSSGLSSPAWYRWVWEQGAEEAPRQALRQTAERLRERGQVVSVADTIAAWTQAQGLARLRGHPTVGRVDLLDAVAATWVKEALDAPVPWSQRSVLHPATHPVLVELLAALTGSVRGQLAADTPLPPLVAHVQAVLRQHDIQPPSSGTRALTLRRTEHARRHALERLVLLEIGGFARAGHETDGGRYVLSAHPDHALSLLEAASYGADLASAAAARIEEQARHGGGFLELVQVLEGALRCGLPMLSEQAIAGLTAATWAEGDLGALGQGMGVLIGLLRHGGLSEADRLITGSLCDAAVDRGLWLAEGLHGLSDLDEERVSAVQHMRDAARLQHPAQTVSSDRLTQVFQRVAARRDAPPDLRGAALGALASLGSLALEEAAELAIEALNTLPHQRLGDFLYGLLVLAREVLAESPSLLSGVQEAVARLDALEFEVALPSLRLAFGALPPRERAGVGRRIAQRHGAQGVSLAARLSVDPATVAAGRALEARVTALLASVGLHDG